VWRKTQWPNFNLPQELWKSTKKPRCQFIQSPFRNTNVGTASSKLKHYPLCREVLWSYLLLWDVVWLHYINYTSLICFVSLFLNKWNLFIHNVISFIYTPLLVWRLQHAKQCWLSNETLNWLNIGFINVVIFISFNGDFYFDETRYPLTLVITFEILFSLNCCHVNVLGGRMWLVAESPKWERGRDEWED